MKTIALTYLILNLLGIMIEPFLFGEERRPYSPSQWAWKTLFHAPLIYLLYKIALS